PARRPARTGVERRAAGGAGDVSVACKGGLSEEPSAEIIVVMARDGTRQTYPLGKFQRSNAGTSYNRRVLFDEGDRVEAGSILADGPSTDQGELAIGKNLLVAFMSWEGHNYEDGIILS